MNNTAKCAHPGCNCPPSDGRKYCSPRCEKAARTSPLTCQCGHAECEAKAAIGAAPIGGE